MFKNIHVGEWSIAISMIMFFLTLGVFLVVIVRACFMPRSKREKMADLPFEDETGAAKASHE